MFRRFNYGVVVQRPNSDRWELINVVTETDGSTPEARKNLAFKKASGWQRDYYPECTVRVISDLGINLVRGNVPDLSKAEFIVG